MDTSDQELDQPQIELVDQSELESKITRKANAALLAKESEIDEKRLQKAKAELDKASRKVKALRSRLNNPRTKISQRKTLQDEITWFEDNELAPLQQDVNDIEQRLKDNKKQLNIGENTAAEGESQRDFLIRTGKITAFGSNNAFKAGSDETFKSHTHLRAPGFIDEPSAAVKSEPVEESNVDHNDGEGSPPSEQDNGDRDVSDDAYSPEELSEGQSEGEIIDSAEVEDLQDNTEVQSTGAVAQRNVDDGDELYYQARLKEWVEQRSKLRRDKLGADAQDDTIPEWLRPHPSIDDAVLNAQFKLPGDVYPSLFEYQKTCVQWLWELYSQKTGGIIGDEMGLGKTIQVIAFLAGLHYSGLLDKPVLLVVPATVLNQWVNEFHRWWPPLRCVILHSIGSGMNKNLIRSEEQLEALMETEDADASQDISIKMANNQINAREIVGRVLEKGHVLITTYVGLRIYSKQILPHEWGYVVLDEGHKIRNPNSEISLACKRVKTYNRIILSGTPIQNNLIELWSLFDFVFPGRLGTLPVFEQQFAVPINMGGYANATNVQVQAGYKCAVILRDLISPYLLRRLKVDVAQDLPKKNEMVVFVKLTKFQQDLYEKFLGSEDVNAIMRGKRNVLMGVDMLRKICNHPDLIDREILSKRSSYNYGLPAKSGKMQVVKNLLQLWQSQGHRTLLFCQTKQMLDILEKFVANLEQKLIEPEENPDYFHYLRMDGSTPIIRRQQLVDTFNTNHYYHVFLLTTKVGGLGVNLTGADRVIIFDPDWNPSTDMQARERAWRLGQTKDITIYRLMTAGTIEEKIYHRQIFKTFLTNKILKDPKQRRFFKLNDLHDLFSLGDPEEAGTETGDLFHGSEKTFSEGKERKSTKLLSSGASNKDDFYNVASMQGVSKLDKFVDADEDADDRNKDDNRIMDGLFSNSGVVQSTLQHDDIVNLSHHDVSIIEREANQVAKEAAEALKKSRLVARRTAVGTPTWTGKFGSAGRFGPKSKGTKRALTVLRLTTPDTEATPNPLSSVSILSEVRSKKATSSADSPFAKKSKTSSDITATNHDSLAKHLTDYLSKQPDFFSLSNSILSSLPKTFDSKSEKQVVLIRSLLREVATWDSARKGWKLKDSYAP
ncbi:hypothetical protein PUMCH_000508 [Australozyma saopauloensis]|uniref:DNA repair and recombination protein RAD26 n=1 Tax=Australozyma saopauloensis TaxID=291208 RepID=A0AAX4H416_9ASCO|nr:hypothetical protein PUMCH_000508 [[Candida] saopauloensis]